jgi:hypothetical protein
MNMLNGPAAAALLYRERSFRRKEEGIMNGTFVTRHLSVAYL